jgi:peroxiredoxin
MKHLIKKITICFALNICVTSINAQVSLLQKAIDKVVGSKNVSYQSIEMFKNPAGDDTTIYQNNATFLKMSEDAIYGYLFRIKQMELVGLFKGGVSIDTYDGQDIMDVNFYDSTYRISKPDIHYFNFRTSLLGNLKWMKDILNNSPSKIAQVSDTTINSSICHHFIFNLYDSIIDARRMYHNLHLFINNSSELPVCVINEGISKFSEGVYFVDYNKSIYSDYLFNQDNVDIASATIPNGFHPPRKQSSLLAKGTVAPNWTLYSTDGKKLSLSELRGKVVLLDFSFIGCGNCMAALKPMNSLHEKYKMKNVVIASIFFRDKSDVVKKFVKDYNIKYPVYVDATSEVTKLYHVPGGPYFYFIDKEGKIEKVIEGYYSGVFEEKTSSIIDSLLNK